MKVKQLLVMMSSFLILTACSDSSIIDSEDVIVTNHIEEERYAVHLDDEGNLVREDVGEEAESQAGSEQTESGPDLSQAASDMVSLDQARAELEAGHPHAAAGTLKKLIATTDKNEEAEDFLQEVQKLQKDEAAAGLSYHYQSELMRQEFGKDKNQDSAEADEAELKSFQAEADIKTDLESLSEGEKSAVQALEKRLSIDIDDYLFWSLNENDREIFLEIRQVESDPAVTNLIGLFKYDLGENQIEKLNVVTGEYEIY